MVFFLFGPCTWEPGQGVPGCRGGLHPFLLCSCSCLVFKRLPQEWSYLSFHLFTCTMGFAPIKWTCTAFFRPRQLTDRAILANRQPQEKKTLVQGASRLRYTDKAQMQRPGHTGRKALATKKSMDHCQELLHSRCLYCRSITHSTRKTGASSLSMEDVRILSPLLSPPSPLSTAGILQMSGNSVTMFGLSALRCKHSDFGCIIGVAMISST